MRYFYKYRTVNPNSIQLLKNQEVYFSFAEEYNDPFDSKMSFTFDFNTSDLLRKLEEAKIPELNKANLRSRIAAGDFSKETIQEAVFLASQKTVMSSCFSRNSDNILMWSHYADSHRGFCVGLRDVSSTDLPALKFDIEKTLSSVESLDIGVFVLYEVDYSDNNFEVFSPFSDDFESFIKAHRKKAKFWHYEEEYRIILPFIKFNKKVLRFEKRTLGEIFLGAKIKPEDKLRILKIVDEEYLQKGYEVNVFEMQISDKEFSLVVNPIDM
jgi:Protein of unknown function (DUF2971)